MCVSCWRVCHAAQTQILSVSDCPSQTQETLRVILHCFGWSYTVCLSVKDISIKIQISFNLSRCSLKEWVSGLGSFPKHSAGPQPHLSAADAQHNLICNTLLTASLEVGLNPNPTRHSAENRGREVRQNELQVKKKRVVKVKHPDDPWTMNNLAITNFQWSIGFTHKPKGGQTAAASTSCFVSLGKTLLYIWMWESNWWSAGCGSRCWEWMNVWKVWVSILWKHVEPSQKWLPHSNKSVSLLRSTLSSQDRMWFVSDLFYVTAISWNNAEKEWHFLRFSSKLLN